MFVSRLAATLYNESSLRDCYAEAGDGEKVSTVHHSGETSEGSFEGTDSDSTSAVDRLLAVAFLAGLV